MIFCCKNIDNFQILFNFFAVANNLKMANLAFILFIALKGDFIDEKQIIVGYKYIAFFIFAIIFNLLW